MIKIAASFICSLAAVLMLVLTLVTNYWQVQWVQNSGANTTEQIYQGLFSKCHRIDSYAETCTERFPLGKPGEHIRTSIDIVFLKN